MICGRAPPPRAEASDFGRARVPCAPAAEAFARAGLRTGLFHSGWFAYLGMEAVVRERGFDTLVDAADIDSPHRSSFGVDDRATARRLLAFVDAVPRGPALLRRVHADRRPPPLPRAGRRPPATARARRPRRLPQRSARRRRRVRRPARRPRAPAASTTGPSTSSSAITARPSASTPATSPTRSSSTKRTCASPSSSPPPARSARNAACPSSPA